MLTNFFGKSNPINVFICGALLLVALAFSFFIAEGASETLTEAFKKLGLWVVFVLSILLLDFVIRKNALSGGNTFSIYIFSGFVLLVPAVFSETNTVFSNLFLLLALRRMSSLTSEKNTEKKIFDASLYIALASLFHFWSFLFYFPLYWVISRMNIRSFRYLFIPIAGIFTVLVLTVTVQLLVYDSLQWFINWLPDVGFNFSAYNKSELLIPSAFIVTMLLWTLVLRVIKFSSMPRKSQQNYRLITITTVTCFAILFLSPVKNGAELLFLFAPLSIVITNYLERLTDIWFKEILLWLFILLPLVILFV